MKFDRKRQYSLRKYKSVGLASAIVGLNMLGVTGALDNVPALNSLFATKIAYAYTPGESGEVTAYYKGRWVGTVEYTVDPGGMIHYNLPQGWSINGVPTNGRYGPIELLTYPESGSSDGATTTTIISSDVYEADPSQDLGSSYSIGRTTYKGTKPSTSQELIDFETKYVKDSTREKGAENLTQKEGEKGLLEKTVNYSVDRNTGDITTLDPEKKVLRAPVNKVKVAAKDKVETIQRGRQTVEKTTQNKQNSTSNRLFILSKISTPTTFYTIIKLNKYHKNISNQKKRGKLVYFPLSCTNLFKSLF